MKRYKEIDVVISSLFILVQVITGLTNTSWFILCIVTAALWQISSIIVHYANNWFMGKNSTRYIFQLIFFSIFAGTIFLLFLPSLPAIILVLLVAITVSYTILCAHEIILLKKRPLSILK